MMDDINEKTQVILTRIVVLPAIGLGRTAAFKHLDPEPWTLTQRTQTQNEWTKNDKWNKK